MESFDDITAGLVEVIKESTQISEQIVVNLLRREMDEINALDEKEQHEQETQIRNSLLIAHGIPDLSSEKVLREYRAKFNFTPHPQSVLIKLMSIAPIIDSDLGTAVNGKMKLFHEIMTPTQTSKAHVCNYVRGN